MTHASTEIVLPKLGESITSATVVQWFKKVGDEVQQDEALLEVTTDKVNSEIPSPIAGTLTDIFAQVDQQIDVGAPLALIQAQKAAAVLSAAIPCTQSLSSSSTKTCDLFSPAVIRLAQSEGIDLKTLQTLKGTGEGGRITKRDIENYLDAKAKAPAVPNVGLAHQEAEEKIPLSGMRKAIAENMEKSCFEVPQASLISEVDVTDVLKLIEAQKERFLQTHGVKLTITTFILQALSKTLMLYPLLNAHFSNQTIICKKAIHLGVAVNVEGGVMVPVIKHAQDRHLISLAKELAHLALRAREKKLVADDVQGATITVTNFGMTGALIGTPIIHHPQVAILGVGAIQKRVVVKDDDSLAIRSRVYLCMTFDHRVVDGVYVCDFLAALKNNLESVSFHS